jgi:predicted nucleic acid-binding Zn ribbon protein
MNATSSSVLPLTAIAFLFTPKQWRDWFGFDSALQILEAARVAKCRREVMVLNDELRPVGWDSMGAPLYSHQLPTPPVAPAF